jgi:hypothetical protein
MKTARPGGDSSVKAPIIGIILVAALASPALADGPVCAPPKLVHITVTDVTPGVAAGTFAAQPRDIYRVGDGKQRVAEALDAPNRLKVLLIVAEPNIWMINLFDGTGRHIVDPGPTFYSRSPVLGVDSLPEKFLSLEYGCEAEYLAANAPKPSRTEQVGGETFEVYRVVDGADAIEVLERPGASIPAYGRYYAGDKLVLAIRYDRYETGLADDPSLFVPPPGIKISDVKSR